MGIIFNEGSKEFHLYNDRISYLMKVMRNGQMGQLYFGKRIPNKENYDYLISCILELDEAYRVVFEYKYLHQMSDTEIAGLLNISPKLANVRFYRARKKLQEMLEKEVAGRAGKR